MGTAETHNLPIEVNSETLTSVFEEGRQSLRLNFYPPYVNANKVMVGLSLHSDASGLSQVYHCILNLSGDPSMCLTLQFPQAKHAWVPTQTIME
ncbi:hypothetical protein L484_023321 [Morus notabilis]|uniref:Uncharacterized protein n=1 Tax=Morus notabilis TaxID=981085 RepID=W9RZ24_9ROSA|nr:hypothetical protein L484_023321 [Morus notabilis]